MLWQGRTASFQSHTQNTAIGQDDHSFLHSFEADNSERAGPARTGGREGGREGRKEGEALPPSLLRLKADGRTVDHSFLNSLGADNRERAWSAAHERCLWGKEGREGRKESILHFCFVLSHSRLFFH